MNLLSQRQFSRVTFVQEILISFLVGIALFVNNKFFSYAEFFPFFGFLLLLGIVSITTGIVLVLLKRKVPLFHPLLIFFITWGIIVFFQQWYFGIDTYKQSLLIGYIYLFILLFFFFSVNTKKIRLFYLLSSLGLLESGVCILQAFKILPPLSPYFAVTGTWNNPNVTGMFLALIFPLLLTLKRLRQNQALRILHLFIFLLFIVALILLKCRSAFLGVAISTLIYSELQYKVFSKIRRNTLFPQLSVVFVVIGLIPILSLVYSSKKASADGRLFIWKRSIEMVNANPLTGCGYGLFARDYNLHQSKFFLSGSNYNVNEFRNAGFVNMAYNEYIENWIEGGYPALLILLLITSFPVYSIITNSCWNADKGGSVGVDRNAVFASLCAFTIMSLVNFSILAIPVMVVYIILIAAFSSYSRGKNRSAGTIALTINVPFFFKSTGFIGAIFVLTGPFLFYRSFQVANAQYELKKATLFVANKKYQEAFSLFKRNEAKLYNSEAYLRAYANLANIEKDHGKAAYLLNQAKRFTSLPDLYKESASLNIRRGNFNAARQELQLALGIEPTSFSTRSMLLQNYIREGNRKAAILLAREILNLKPKMKSGLIKSYKGYAKRVLEKYEVKALPIYKPPFFGK